MPHKASAIIALDLGGTKLASGLFTADGKLLARREEALKRRSGSDVGAMIAEHVLGWVTAAKGKRRLVVRGVGVSIPGIAHARTGKVWAPNIPGWDDYPLAREITGVIDDPSIKVHVDDDRAASILGEAWQGAARGCRNAVFLAVGTGIGAGILADGCVLRGAHGIAGAIGWMALDRPFKPTYVPCGCFEHYASGAGLARVANAGSGREVFARDDATAKRAVKQAVEFWGMAAANVVSLFNPEKVIFGGGVFGPAARFIDDIAAEAKRWAQPVSMSRVTFEVSQLGPQAALYGAAHLALRRLGKSHVP